MAKYYFIKEKVEPIILEWQLLDPSTPKANQLLNSITYDIIKIVDGIIFTHKFLQWNIPFEDLQQEAMESVIKSLKKYNPKYEGSGDPNKRLFNYISLTAKRCLTFYSMRDSKHRNLAEIKDGLAVSNFSKSQYHQYVETGGIDNFDKDGFLLDLERYVRSRKHAFLMKMRGPVERLFFEKGAAMDTYFDLLKESDIFNKRAFFAACRINHPKLTQSRIRIFLKIMQSVLLEFKRKHL